MNCYIALMLKNAAMSFLLIGLPIGDCQPEANRINVDPQYEMIWAYCEVVIDEDSNK